MQGVVSVTCCDAYVSSMVMPSLAGLCEQHPGLEVAVANDSRPFDLSKREADLALRVLAVGASPPEQLVGKPLVPITACGYVGTEHADTLTPDADGARWIAYDDPKTTRMMVRASAYPDLPPWGAFSSIETLTQAAYAGLGYIMVPTYVGDPDPRLQRLPEPALRHVADLWLLYHPDLRDNARVRAARRCTEQAIVANVDLFRG